LPNFIPFALKQPKWSKKLNCKRPKMSLMQHKGLSVLKTPYTHKLDFHHRGDFNFNFLFIEL